MHPNTAEVLLVLGRGPEWVRRWDRDARRREFHQVIEGACAELAGPAVTAAATNP
jgi:hypothetical protein